MSDAVGQALVRSSLRHLREEFLPRLERCVAGLTLEELWWRPNASTVSAGNLLLHLDGNVRQWILGGLGGRPVDRDRDGEFSATGPVPGDELIARLRATLDEAAEVLEGLDPAALAAPRRIQGFDTDGVDVLVHVVEHFSYHTGQVTWRLKAGKDVVTDYYDEAHRDLNVD
jgi:uncharacterized damage-inducible protein DinB